MNSNQENTKPKEKKNKKTTKKTFKNKKNTFPPQPRQVTKNAHSIGPTDRD